MTTGCRAKNPTTCKVHGMGGSVERLQIDKSKAVRAGDFVAQYEIQKRIDNLRDEDPNIPQESKVNFFGKLGQKIFNAKGYKNASPAEESKPAKEPVTLREPDTIEAASDNIAKVLDYHGVFGGSHGEVLEYEMNDFKKRVQDNATSNEEVDSVVFDYKETNTRVIVRTDIVEGKSQIVHIVAFSHPHKDDRIDYTSLNKDIVAAYK